MKEQIKVVRLELTGEFAGMWIEVQKNPPISVYDELLDAVDLPRVKAALARMARATNIENANDELINFRTVEGWGQISVDLIGEIAMQIKAMMAPPKATQNGSMTPGPTEVASSPPTTTT